MAPRDNLDFMVREVQALVKTYLEGAGIVAWRERPDGQGYEAVTIPPADRVSTVDDVLYRIANEIRTIAPPGQEPPPPEIPTQTAVDVSRLESDPEEES